MKSRLKILALGLIVITSFHCSSIRPMAFKPKEVYHSESLIITQVSENAFVHVSFLQTNDFGNVPCNGLLVRNSGETIVFDTPANEPSAAALVAWIKDSMHCKINAVIPTHFHKDCLAGLQAFGEAHVPSYANYKTIELAKQNNYPVPQNGFKDSLLLKIGNEHVTVKYFGEGHTTDNVVGYFPSEQILFGGCLIKELKAGKGFLGDANLGTWSATVEKVKAAYPGVKLVVPGHGEPGNKKLFDYTIDLFRVQ